MKPLEAHKEILHVWGKIQKHQHQIEDKHLEIGKLKDKIELLEAEICRLQKHLPETNEPV